MKTLHEIKNASPIVFPHVDTENNIIYIDNSTLDAYRRCGLYFYYWSKGLILSDHSPATYFGTVWHEVMHELYGRYVDDDESDSSNTSWSLDHIMDYTLNYPYDKNLEDDRRNLKRIQSAAYEYYHEIEPDGRPYTHRKDTYKTLLAEEFLSYPLTKITFDGTRYDVYYSGILDRVYHDNDSNGIYCMDYKTTSWNQITDAVWNLSTQFWGYIWLVEKHLQQVVDGFHLDMLQIQSKTTNKFISKIIPYDKFQVELWRNSTISLLHSIKPMIDHIIVAENEEYTPEQFIHRSNNCNMYGQCPYYHLCMMEPDMRPDIMKTMYTVKHWDMHGTFDFSGSDHSG
jgi:RecB family exonuclease